MDDQYNAQPQAASEREQKQHAAMSAACADARLIMGRATPLPPGLQGAIAGHSHSVQPSCAPFVSVGGFGDVALPPGEAFTRATCEAMLRNACAAAVQRDRLRLQDDGWTLKGVAAQAFAEMLGAALDAENVPRDARAAIVQRFTMASHLWTLR